jgi:uncharacterized membrane protein YraQ (UPF0718 family)
MNRMQGNGMKGKGPGAQKGGGGSTFTTVFLAIVVGVYLVTAILDYETFIAAVQTFLGIMLQILPVLVLVFALIFLVDLFIRPQAIARHLGYESGIKGWLLAVVAGIIATGPVYVWYSMLADFQEKGMRIAFSGVFLYMRSVKLPFIPLMIYYFGGAFTAVVTFYLIVFSILAGICCEKVVRWGRRAPAKSE